MKLPIYRSTALPAIAFLLQSLRAGAFDPLIFNPVDAYVECQPVVFSWSGALPPYDMGVLGTRIKTLPATNATSLTWVVDFPAGTVVRAAVRSLNTSSITFASIPALTVMAGNDSTCLSS
ncbi:Secreted protein [Mycena venus]|uniref:Secreted protein n=1 Tax=Mycena venus TaxID=2733690 RepID=A0A8H7D9H8_9AGAR|nr:Secreted protein [Mycena venus]